MSWFGKYDQPGAPEELVGPAGLYQHHYPDGTDYKNKSGFDEIVPYKKITYAHLSGPKFLASIAFESRDGQTAIEWQMSFDIRDALIQTVKTFRADEGLQQNPDKRRTYTSRLKDRQ